MRRRESPYSQIKAIRHSRGELVVLVLGTVALGMLLNLLANELHDALWPSGKTPEQQWLVLTVEGLITLALIVSMVLFYGRMESRRALIEVWLPYHWPESNHPVVAQRHSYKVTIYARHAFARRYPRNSPQTQALAATWCEAVRQGVSFQQFIAPVNAQLIQHLLLCALHRYGEDSLSPEAAYSWWAVDLPAEQLSMDDLPGPVHDNPFLRADQKPEEWRLWWPRDVRLELHSDGNNPFPTWRFVHRRYGYLEMKAHPQLVVAGRESQPVQVFQQRLKLSKRSQLYIVGTRLEAMARFQWAFLPGSEPFHDWATGLLSYLEEALDWGYFLATRPDRLITDLDWRMGWVPEGTSVWKKLEDIEARLEELEMEAEVPGSLKPGGS